MVACLSYSQVINLQVDATQRTLLESLPSVLVLHLKWFTYNKDGGLQKNSKKFDLDVNLEITRGKTIHLTSISAEIFS